MKTIITKDQLNEMFYESYVERNVYVLDSGYHERQFSASLNACKGDFYDVSFDGVYIGYGELDLTRNVQIHYESPQEMISMLFLFSGCTVMQHEGLSSESVLLTGTHNLFYLNEEVGQKEWMNCPNYPSKHLRGLEISFTPELFKRFLPGDSHNLHAFTGSIKAGRSAAFASCQPIISPPMMHIIYDILHCEKPAALRKLFFASKAMELFMLQIDQLQCGNGEYLVSKQNQDRMFEVKSFLESHLDPDFSIHSLAKAFGTNEYTLQKEFKFLFGKSIFDYWNSSRFDYAKQLLKEGYSIQQLAEKLGYSNTQNFSTAFKKRFGVPPSFFK